MTMRNPAMAVLWESWRLSRLRLAIMVFLAAFGGAALIASPVDAAESAAWALMLAGFMAWISPAWAGNVDARKGFSLALGFARPIPTCVLVSVPMARFRPLPFARPLALLANPFPQETSRQEQCLLHEPDLGPPRAVTVTPTLKHLLQVAAHAFPHVRRQCQLQ